MRKLLTTLGFLIGLIAMSGGAHAQELGWARSGDLAACLNGSASTAACTRVRWTFFIWPNILKELENAMSGDPDPAPNLVFPRGFLDEVAIPGGRLSIPNPEDPDRPWGPLGPLVRESLFLNSYLMRAVARPRSAHRQKLDKTLLSPDATLNDMEMVRGALKQTVKAIDEEIASYKKGRK